MHDIHKCVSRKIRKNLFVTDKLRSTVKAAYKKFIGFIPFRNKMFIERPFQFEALPLPDKCSTNLKYLLTLNDSIYKLVT